MPSGVYDRHMRANKDQAITEVRNYLRGMVARESLDYFVGLYERMPLRKVKQEPYDNPWRSL